VKQKNTLDAVQNAEALTAQNNEKGEEIADLRKNLTDAHQSALEKSKSGFANDLLISGQEMQQLQDQLHQEQESKLAVLTAHDKTIVTISTKMVELQEELQLEKQKNELDTAQNDTYEKVVHDNDLLHSELTQAHESIGKLQTRYDTLVSAWELESDLCATERQEF
jgi:hypothetical protein